ncbi:MAG: succinate dehydrogenase [Roseovarius sp.]|nr:succinate dehydrogenase [Roseovarius sp.]
MRILLGCVALVGLTACDAANQAADTVARDRAKGVVNGVVETRFPGVNAAPVTDCIINQASASEIVSIAGASVTGVTQSTVEQVVEIASRPDAVTCIAQNSLTLLGG